MIRRGSLRLGCVVPVRSFWWFLEPFLGDFLGAISRPFSLGFGGGCMHEPFVVLFPLIPLPNPWAKGLDFGVFGVLWLGVLGVDSSRFSKFLWTKYLLRSVHEVFLLSPKSCANPWSDSGERELDLGELTRGCCSSRRAQVTPIWPVPLTGLTGADSSWVLLGWTFGCVCCCPMLLLFQVWVSLELGRPVWWIWGFPGLNRSDRCRGLFVEVPRFHQLGLVWPVALTGLTGVGQWGSSWCSAAFSGPWSWLLVPRASSTPVAVWSCLTWVVSQRRVLEVVFILLESLSPSRRIFIGSHSLPSLWFTISVLQSRRCMWHDKGCLSRHVFRHEKKVHPV
jgi:hypothetical protein